MSLLGGGRRTEITGTETIRSEALELEIVPDLGASILNLRSVAGRPVLRPVELGRVETSSQCASFTLLPFSNRIRDARFAFGGQDIELRANAAGGLAQHGDVRNRPWQVTRVSASHLRCTFDSRQCPDLNGADFNWPWHVTAGVEYRLHGPHCDISVGLTNADVRPMPAGMGLHPYFERRSEVDPALHVGAALIYDTDGQQLPTGAARPVRPEEDFRSPSPLGTRSPDATYAAWDGVARLDWGERALTLTADPVFSHFVVFAAPDGSLALEPTSHATDAFNLAARGVSGVGMQVLEPGQTLAGTVRLTVEGNW